MQRETARDRDSDRERETETETERATTRTVDCHRPAAPGKGKRLYIIISNVYNVQ